MQRKPRVPSALLAHLPTEEQDKLKRKHTEISALAPTTPDSTEAFLELRLRNLDSSLDYTRQYGNALNKSRKALGVNEEELKKELRKLDDTARELNLEAVTVKRQKRLILEDLKDTAPSRETMGKAYASVIMNKVMAASKTKFDKPRYLQTEFKKMICDYLHASKMDQGEEYVWCHVTAQWYLASETKTAHIVPKSLDGDEVAYLFGVGAISMSDERNGT